MAYSDIDKPSDYFNTVLWTGTGSAMSITGVGFQPDWVWYKARSFGYNHGLFDSVRGASKFLKSNSTDAEATLSGVTSFDSDGFSLGTDAGGVGSGNTFVGWNWLAGGTASSNTDGSITSNVSANTTSGFSIVSYTGSGVYQDTVGHGLGEIPKMIIVKMRSPDTREWIVYHSSLGNTQKIHLNDTAAAVTQPAWGNTTPTSSVFTISGASQTNWHDTNKASATYIAYCFAEKKGYSKFGSYTGNGSTDGTFIYTGFKPAWLMFKRTDSTAGWFIQDNKRDTYNVVSNYLTANTSDAEATSGTGLFDFTSNGFKIRNSGPLINASGGTFIYMAFASQPFVTSSGVCATAR